MKLAQYILSNMKISGRKDYFQKLFGIGGIALGLVFIGMYLNRWWASFERVIPVSIYDNFLTVEVLKLQHGARLYDSSAALPNDHVYGPFPAVVIYLLKTLLPTVTLPTLANLLAILSALVFAVTIALLSTKIHVSLAPAQSNSRWKEALFIGFLSFVAIPKTYLLFYHPEAICYSLFALALLLALSRGTYSKSDVVDLLLGVLAVAAFLTKANYISVYVAITFMYLFIFKRNIRSLVLFHIAFFSILLLVVFAFCSSTGWFWWTIYLPAITPRMWGTLLTGLYSGPFMALLILVSLGSISVRMCQFKEQRLVLLTFAIVITALDLMNAVKSGGTMWASSNHAIFAWIPLLIPGFRFILERAGSATILAVVCLGVLPHEPSASTLSNTSRDQLTVAQSAVQKYSSALFLTEVNWSEPLLNTKPQFSLDSFLELCRAGIESEGSSLTASLRKADHYVIADRFFSDQLPLEKKWLSGTATRALDSINAILQQRYSVIDSITVGEHSSISLEFYAKVYGPKR